MATGAGTTLVGVARRRRRRSSERNLYAVVIVGLLVFATIALVVRYWPFAVALLIVVVAMFSYRYWRRRKARTTAARAQVEAAQVREERWEANRQAWRALTFEPGTFSVVVSGFGEPGDAEEVAEFLSDIPELRDRPVDEVEALVERAVHIAPQTVAEGIAQKNAIHLKEALELRGGEQGQVLHSYTDVSERKT